MRTLPHPTRTLPTALYPHRSRLGRASPQAPLCGSCDRPPPPLPARVGPRRATAAAGETAPPPAPAPVVRARCQAHQEIGREIARRAARHAPRRAAAGGPVVPRGHHPRCGSPARRARAPSAASPSGLPSDEDHASDHVNSVAHVSALSLCPWPLCSALGPDITVDMVSVEAWPRSVLKAAPQDSASDVRVSERHGGAQFYLFIFLIGFIFNWMWCVLRERLSGVRTVEGGRRESNLLTIYLAWERAPSPTYPGRLHVA